MESDAPSRFDDYTPPTRRIKPPQKLPVSVPKAGGSGGGNAKQENDCELPLTDVRLEDVARCEYYSRHRTVPQIGGEIQIRRELFNGRIAVELASGNQIIGLLPTSFNYVLRCIADGYSYTGQVADSSVAPTPDIVVDLESSR